ADGGSPGLAVVRAEPAEVLADGERLVAALPEAGVVKRRGRPVVEELLDPQAAGSPDDLEAERAAGVVVAVGAALLPHGVGAPRRGLGPEAEVLDPQAGRQVRRPKDHEVAPGLGFFPGYGAEPGLRLTDGVGGAMAPVPGAGRIVGRRFGGHV